MPHFLIFSPLPSSLPPSLPPPSPRRRRVPRFGHDSSCPLRHRQTSRRSICEFHPPLPPSFPPSLPPVLVVDDFLASGTTAVALLDIVRQAGATCVGFGFLVEKEFEKGRDLLLEALKEDEGEGGREGGNFYIWWGEEIEMDMRARRNDRWLLAFQTNRGEHLFLR